MNNEEQLLQEYAALSSKIKSLEIERDALKAKVQEIIISRGGSIDVPYGKFAIQQRANWTYPASVTELEEKYKIAKIDAEQSGAATNTPTQFIKFDVIKL